MAFASGLIERCESYIFDDLPFDLVDAAKHVIGRCGSTKLPVLSERYDERERLFLGEQKCQRCGAYYLYSRRPTKDEAADLSSKGHTMAKRKAGRQKSVARSGNRVRSAHERAKPKARQATPAKRRPRQQDLPGTEDRAIKPLEDIAAAYADVRDRRIELNREEAELKQHAIALMKQFEKTIYKHDGIEIRLVPGEEDVKVKVKKPGDDQQPAEERAEPAESGDDLEVAEDETGADAEA